MPLRSEPLNGGVVQVRHPALLKEGEVQQAADCILRPADPAIHKAPGRLSYGTVRASTVACTLDGTTTITSTNGFGTNTANASTTIDKTTVTHGSGFGGAPAVGKTIVSPNLPAGTVITRVVSGLELIVSKVATVTGVNNVTVTISNFHPGTFISGTGVTAGTTISSITDEDALVMSATGVTGTPTLTFSENISGLSYLPFNTNFQDILLAKSAEKLLSSDFDSADSGNSFTTLFAGLSNDAEARLVTIPLSRNRHAILTGFDEPRTVYYRTNTSAVQTLSSRALGMQPVTDFPAPNIITGKAWSTRPDMGPGFYYFLITEVAKFGPNDEIESGFTREEGPIAVELVDVTDEGIQVNYFATPINNGVDGQNTATHWRIYMFRNDPLTGEFPPPALSSFTFIAEVDIGTTSVELNETAIFQSGWADDFQVGANPDGDKLFFTADGTNAMARVPRVQVVTVAGTAEERKITVAGGLFSTVSKGMIVTSPNDNLPPGTEVSDIATDNNTVFLSKAVVNTFTSDTIYFGNEPADLATFALTQGSTSSEFRGTVVHDIGIQNQGAFSTSTISGIKVEIFGITDGPESPGLRVDLTKDASGSTFGTILEGNRHIRHSISLDTIVLGGPGQLWGLTWIPADFIDGLTSFGIRIRQNPATSTNQNNITVKTSGIRVTIYGGVGNLFFDDTKKFESIIVADRLGTQIALSARGPAPIASTGDLFQGQLILNDKQNPQNIVASLPDDEDAFPIPYFMPFESRERNDVTVIRRLKNVLIVGCTSSIKRVSYFPTEFSAEYSRGQAWEDLATDHGMVGPEAATLLNIPGRGMVLAYLAHNGLHVTDGVTTNFLNEDLDWGTLIEPTLIQRSTLVVYPRLSLMALYYVPSGGTRKTAAFYFSYHPIHVKEGGRLPAVGPLTYNSGSATQAFLDGRTYLLTGHGDDGDVYIEDNGTTDGAGNDIDPTIRTRRIYPFGIGTDARAQRILLLVDADGTTSTGAFTVQMFQQEQGSALASSGDAISKETSVGGVIDIHDTDTAMECFEVGISKDASAGETAAFRLHFLTYQVEPYGEDTRQ